MALAGGIAALVCFVTACAATWLVQRMAPRLGLVQAPNARSSHIRPTPTGGGIGIVLGVLIAAIVPALSAPWSVLPITAAALGMAIIGLWDDITPVRWYWRLGAQLVLFGALAFLMLPPLVAVPAILAGVLFINLYNFMDGIDGLAASEGAFVFLGASLLLATMGLDGWWLAGLGAACLGFLVFNFPPARIFMGDVGSTALGLAIAALALLRPDVLGPWVWLILAAVFVTDGLVTLTRRLLQGERVFEAHRRHAYQILSRRYGSHRPVTLGVLAINVVWLLPLAWFAWGNTYAPLIAFVAYAPLVVGALLVGAGRKAAGEL